MLWEDATQRGGTNRVPVAPGNYLDWRQANPAFTDLAAIYNSSYRLSSIEEPLVPLTHRVTANYFDLLEVEPFLGRTFAPDEDQPGHDRVVINEALADLYFVKQDPVGRSLVIEASGKVEVLKDKVERQIVGVVGNVRTAGTHPEPISVIYLPQTQTPVATMNLVMRTRGDPDALLREAERVAWGMAGDINVYSVETVEQRISSFQWTSEVSSLLFTLFAALALVLGAAGIYAVISYTVAKHTQEIGVRMALGAARASVLRMVLTDGLKLTLIGVAAGVRFPGRAE